MAPPKQFARSAFAHKYLPSAIFINKGSNSLSVILIRFNASASTNCIAIVFPVFLCH